MSLRNSIRTAVLVVIASTAVLVAPSASWAADNYLSQCGGATVSCQTGIRVGAAITADWCGTSGASGTEVCVKTYGDEVFVKDNLADGKAALARIDGTAGSVHQRYCRNTSGAGTWAACDFDWVEGSLQEAYGGIRIDESSYTLSRVGSFRG